MKNKKKRTKRYLTKEECIGCPFLRENGDCELFKKGISCITKEDRQRVKEIFKLVENVKIHQAIIIPDNKLDKNRIQ